MKAKFKEFIKISIIAITVVVMMKTIVFIKYEDLQTTKNQIALCSIITILMFFISICYDIYTEKKKDKQNKEE